MFIVTDVADQLTESNKGKHHIGDFLPPEELEKFMEKVKAIQGECEPGKYNIWWTEVTLITADLSDYAKNKIDENNIGYQMLKNAGWTEGQGLGSNEDGITAPVNKFVLLHYIIAMVAWRVNPGAKYHSTNQEWAWKLLGKWAMKIMNLTCTVREWC